MDLETSFMNALSQSSEEEKLASALSQMSVEELTALYLEVEEPAAVETPKASAKSEIPAEKIAMVQEWGRDLAKLASAPAPKREYSTISELEKAAFSLGGVGKAVSGIAQKAMPTVQNVASKALPAAQVGLGKLQGSMAALGSGKMMGYGAMAGGALGAAKGLVAPGKDANGQQKSRLGAMAGGAAKGAVGGAVLGAAAPTLATHAQQGMGATSRGIANWKPAIPGTP
jgi:hypothetical protein